LSPSFCVGILERKQLLTCKIKWPKELIREQMFFMLVVLNFILEVISNSLIFLLLISIITNLR